MTRWVRGIFEALRPLETLPVEGLIRIWAHEALRLFQDRWVENKSMIILVKVHSEWMNVAGRLVEDEERRWTDENIDTVALKHFPNIDREKGLNRPILYSNWLSKVSGVSECCRTTPGNAFNLLLLFCSPVGLCSRGAGGAAWLREGPTEGVLRGGAGCSSGSL